MLYFCNENRVSGTMFDKYYWLGDSNDFIFLSYDELHLMRHFLPMKDLQIACEGFMYRVMENITYNESGTFYRGHKIWDIDFSFVVYQPVLLMGRNIVVTINDGFLFLEYPSGDFVAFYNELEPCDSPLVAKFLIQYPNLGRSGCF